MTADLWSDWRAINQLVQTDYPDAIPIILVHGWNGNEFTWPPAEELKKLEVKLSRDIYFFTYRSGLLPERFPPMEILEEQFEHFLADFHQVDVIAHSMGGLLVRTYLQHHSGTSIRRIVFLSTPHFGTDAAKVLTEIANIGPLGNLQAEEMRPGSYFLWQLNEDVGHELQSLEILNVYVGEGSPAQSDFVVDEHSAYLPGQNNVGVDGDHHTLPKNLHESDSIIRFLTDGELPPLSKKPKRRDLWVRIHDADRDRDLSLYPASVKRLDSKGIPKSGTAGISVCCQAPSDLYGVKGSTIIIENILPAERLVFFLRGNLANVEVETDALLSSERPIIFRALEAHSR
ncbi:MAG: alpha/beta fold hydrolase [Mariprofundaceae bacterium]